MSRPLWHIAMEKWNRGKPLTPEEDAALEEYLNGWMKTRAHADRDLPLGDKF